MTLTEAAAETIQRYRCDGSKCLRTADQLINIRQAPDGRRDYVIASGPCGKCGASFHMVYGELGPADLSNHYSIVGVKVARMDSIKCGRGCQSATSLECKCSCGGARHGLASS